MSQLEKRVQEQESILAIWLHPNNRQSIRSKRKWNAIFLWWSEDHWSHLERVLFRYGKYNDGNDLLRFY